MRKTIAVRTLLQIFVFLILYSSFDGTAESSETHTVEPSSSYVLHRIMNGVPEGMDDIPPGEAFPMDSNLDIMGGGTLRPTVPFHDL